jgi:hypothetical protein
MKNYCLLISFFFFGSFLNAQEQLTIEISPNGQNLKIYPLPVEDGQPTLYIDQYGNPGIEMTGNNSFRWSEYKDATEGKPEEINGIRFSYYNNLDHDGFLQSFGDIELEYYDRMPGEAQSTRLHYINDIEITYHDIMQGPPKQGKIKSIDGILLDYYYGFDNQGKLSRAGKYRIYYNQEDNRSGKSGRPDAIEGNDTRLSIYISFDFNQKYNN